LSFFVCHTITSPRELLQALSSRRERNALLIKGLRYRKRPSAAGAMSKSTAAQCQRLRLAATVPRRDNRLRISLFTSKPASSQPLRKPPQDRSVFQKTDCRRRLLSPILRRFVALPRRIGVRRRLLLFASSITG
jgi:hypothetical protein